MEVSGSVIRRSPAGFIAGEVLARRRGGMGFSDEGHVRYYRQQAVRCGVKKKEEKRRAKLVKGLSKDLSDFYSMGFGIEAGYGMAGEVKGKMISEAAELLLAQLKQLRAEEKELKRKRKQEKAAAKAARMKDCADDDTSSSSSESSDSDCQSVMPMSSPQTKVFLAEPKTQPNQGSLTCNQALSLLEPRMEAPKLGLGCSNSTSEGDRIEVCMGGKCKKSGATELLAEFEKKVGMEGAVVGCKCMGKCRDAPNVRVLNSSSKEYDFSRNPLCIGVGLEDVGTIVANFFGEKNVGLLAA